MSGVENQIRTILGHFGSSNAISKLDEFHSDTLLTLTVKFMRIFTSEFGEWQVRLHNGHTMRVSSPNRWNNKRTQFKYNSIFVSHIDKKIWDIW